MGLQRGRGVGSFFINMLRSLKPMARAGLSAVSNQLKDSGRAIASEIGTGAKPLRQIFKEQGTAAVSNLADRGIKKIRKMSGGSIKRKKKE